MFQSVMLRVALSLREGGALSSREVRYWSWKCHMSSLARITQLKHLSSTSYRSPVHPRVLLSSCSQ